MEEKQADGVSILLMNPQNGEILAMVNVPEFNLNDPFTLTEEFLASNAEKQPAADTKDPENLWDVRQSAGMVFQNPDNQIIGTVVEEDVGFGPENLGVPADEIWKRVEESLKDVGMLEYRKSSPNKLSGGQKQRVAIAGVIAMEPKCIVLDEPTAMLDPNGRKEVIKTVRRLQKTKSNGDPDHPLYGRSDRGRSGICYG